MKIKSFSIRKEYYRSNEPQRFKNKMYIFPYGETLLENLQNRRSRPYKIYKEEVIPMVMERIKKKYPDYYEELKDTKWSWSRKCGCSMCPCSPGFIGSTTGFFEIQVEITN